MTARRIFVSISPKSPFWFLACESAEALVDLALGLVKKKGLVEPDDECDPRFLVEERWGLRTHIVFDINHRDYDSNTAHLPRQINNLPVAIVSLNRTESVQTASKLLEDKINSEVRKIHGAHAVGIEPPFIVDHTEGKIPCYPNPRSALAQPRAGE
ncbi:hypothetical protein N658DRAFT_489537 [Parathielavia hyrcaniae]|uniref:Uncharacterized protein n=1 Tax=Parathielavia hyrcaniae TaxID=113614 RepID=A0AAN6PTZ3_9PEZI|nr:hypothetical protein N658DRAFT_489537 [Parathielavia hyrcaniae]